MSIRKGEEVELTQTISTAKARGQVEKWLLELERIMKDTVHSQIFDAFESYSSDEFTAWISHWPGQFVCMRNKKNKTLFFSVSFNFTEITTTKNKQTT